MSRYQRETSVNKNVIQWWFTDDPEMSSDRNPEEDWEFFWKDLCVDSAGEINLDQVKKELSDYMLLMSQVTSLHLSLTNNIISKPFTRPEDVLQLHNELYMSKEIVNAWDN